MSKLFKLFKPFLKVLAQSAGKVSNASGLVLETFQGILQSLDEPIFRKSHLFRIHKNENCNI